MAAIVFEGDYVRGNSGNFSRVTNICNWDENGDADLYLADGSVTNSRDVSINDVKSENEYLKENA